MLIAPWYHPRSLLWQLHILALLSFCGIHAARKSSTLASCPLSVVRIQVV